MSDIQYSVSRGCNAIHLYTEDFVSGYAPGSMSNYVDQVVAMTRTNGLYLVMTIANSWANGSNSLSFATNFWKFYAPRYANETHVLYEIHNEPVAWGPPYSSPTANPPDALNMEEACYKIIRASAPNTPVLLFSYSVLGGSGGASAALTDIQAFNTDVFGNANAVWTNEAVAFHGYAGAAAASNAVAQIIAAGYPCFQTEFIGSIWGQSGGALDTYGVAYWERLGVSWLTFQFSPTGGFSDPYFKDVVNWSGLSWTPDQGNWPAVRGPYGNGGYPWTTPGFNTNNLLTGSLRIEAENFDSGGEGVAYHMTNTIPATVYRTTETVPVETTPDAGGGYDVTGAAAGEWLDYTIHVSEPGYYNLALRVASTSAGSVRVLAGGINGTNLTGTWTVPATGGAQTWTTISNTVFLTPGQQILHLNILSGGFNLNWLQLSPVPAGIIADGSYKLLNRSSALAITGVAVSNKVVAATYTGTSAQRWNFQHLGGGEYKITCVENGWSLTSGGFYFWNNNRFLIQPVGDGSYRIVPSGNGYCFETTTANETVVDEEVSSGGANQQWAIVAPAVPAFPTGLNAVKAGPTAAALTWNPVAGATTYNVKRSTNSGGTYTTIATGVTSPNYTDIGLSVGLSYYYVVSAVAGGVESMNSGEAALRNARLNGTIIGTLGSWNNSGNTITNVFDGNLNTFFDAPSGSGSSAWVGLDFGAGVTNVIAQINYCPRSGFGARMVGGVFQGASQANFSDAITLFTITNQPASGAFTSVSVTNTGFRHVRYLSPNGGYCNVAELEFYGYPFSDPVLGPSGLNAVAVSASQINLVWNSVTNAGSYTVKRSMTNGGPYTTIASGVTATNYSDSSLAGGTVFYYTVSAVVSGSETLDSLQATASTFSPTYGSLVHRYSFNESGGTSVADSVAGPIWNGTLPNGGTLSGGTVTLSNASQNYVSLPAGIVSSLSNFTIMAWVKLNSTANWARIFDFGDDTTTYMYLTPQNGNTGTLRFAITTNSNGGQQMINCGSILSTGVWQQVAVTLSGTTGILYLNGAAVGTNSGITLKPMTLGPTANNYIGKSQWPDPYLDGALDEFRIFNAALSDSEIAATAALGAGQLLNTNSPPLSVAQTGGSLLLAWPLANADYTVQVRTNLALGQWENLVPPAPQIVGSQWRVTLPSPDADASAFYRLSK